MFSFHIHFYGKLSQNFNFCWVKLTWWSETFAIPWIPIIKPNVEADHKSVFLRAGESLLFECQKVVYPICEIFNISFCPQKLLRDWPVKKHIQKFKPPCIDFLSSSIVTTWRFCLSKLLAFVKDPTQFQFLVLHRFNIYAMCKFWLILSNTHSH